jgi:hypothetical protein
LSFVFCLLSLGYSITDQIFLAHLVHFSEPNVML